MKPVFQNYQQGLALMLVVSTGVNLLKLNKHGNNHLVKVKNPFFHHLYLLLRSSHRSLLPNSQNSQIYSLLCRKTTFLSKTLSSFVLLI